MESTRGPELDSPFKSATPRNKTECVSLRSGALLWSDATPDCRLFQIFSRRKITFQLFPGWIRLPIDPCFSIRFQIGSTIGSWALIGIYLKTRSGTKYDRKSNLRSDRGKKGDRGARSHIRCGNQSITKYYCVSGSGQLENLTPIIFGAAAKAILFNNYKASVSNLSWDVPFRLLPRISTAS